MNKPLLLLALILVFFSCSENPTGSSALKIRYLSQVTLNGKLITKHYYGNDLVVDSMNSYDTSGLSWTHYEYHYTNGKPAVVFFRSCYSDGRKYPSHRLEYSYNQQGYIKKLSLYVDTVLKSYTLYEYNSANQRNKVSAFYNDTLIYYQTFSFNNHNTHIQISTPNDTFFATIDYAYDTKINPYSFLSSNATIFEKHNCLNASSSTAPDSSGRIRMSFTNITLALTAFSSEFEYNADNYPVKEYRTIRSVPPKVQVYEYEYLPNTQ